MTVTLSAGREKERFLDKNKLLSVIREALGNNKERVRKLEARASLDGGENTDLNFLPNKLQYLGEIRVERNQPSLESRVKAIQAAFMHFKEYISTRE